MTDEEIMKACPFCGCAEPETDTDSNRFWVGCPACEANGPVVRTCYNDAAKAWNSVPDAIERLTRERDDWRDRESETQDALQAIGEEFGALGGEPRTSAMRRLLTESRAERDAARAALAASEVKVAKLRNMVGALADQIWQIAKSEKTEQLIADARDVLAAPGRMRELNVDPAIIHRRHKPQTGR